MHAGMGRLFVMTRALLSAWIMTNLNHNMTTMERPMQMQR